MNGDKTFERSRHDFIYKLYQIVVWGDEKIDGFGHCDNQDMGHIKVWLLVRDKILYR